MPDLPSRLCAKCGYKVKIFYLLTRQFVLGQYAMRATITEWYHNKYNIEPPEQVEDQKRLQQQLAMSEVAAPPLPALISVTPSVSTTDHKRKEKPEKKLPTTTDQGGVKRSISVEGEHGRSNVPGVPQVSGQRNKLDVGKMTRSAANLNFPGKERVLLKKHPQVGVANTHATYHSYIPPNMLPLQIQQQEQQKRTRAEQSERGLATRPSSIGSPSHHCYVTARTVKPSARQNMLGAPNSNPKTHTKTSTTNAPLKSDEAASKPQLHGQQLQDLKKRWR